MPRPKGPGAIKFIDPAKDTFLGIRHKLRRGQALLEDKLRELYAQRESLIAQLISYNARARELDAVIEGQSLKLADMKKARAIRPKLARLRAEIEASETKLRHVESEITCAQQEVRRAMAPSKGRHLINERKACKRLLADPHTGQWTKNRLRAALRRIDKELVQLRLEFGRAELQKAHTKSVFGWQAEAMRLIEIQALSQRGTEAKTLSPSGKRLIISIARLRAELHAEGHEVDARQLRRFVSGALRVKCASEQGRRRDLEQ